MYDNYIFDLYGTLVDIRTNENKASLWKYMAGYMTLQGASYSAAELRKRYRSLISAEQQKQYEKHKDLIPKLTQDHIEVDLLQVFSRLYQENHNCGLSCMYIHTAQSPELTGCLPRGCRRLKTISEVLLQN